MTTSIKSYTLSLLSLIIFGTLLGCTTPTPTSPRIVDTLVFKNSTGDYIQQVSISKDLADPRTRFGSVSPLPINAQQVFERPTKAKALPKTLQVQWITSTNKVYKKEISIESLLLSVSKEQHITLIIDFQMLGVINAYIKN